VFARRWLVVLAAGAGIKIGGGRHHIGTDSLNERSKQGRTEMATAIPTATGTGQDLTVEEKINQLRELFADAPQYAKTAVENVLDELKSQVESEPPASRMESAGRAGSRQGKVSELTLLVPFAPGGAQRLRGFLQLLDGDFDGADKVGTVHDMRFVFLDNDTRMLFATAYDGDWDVYLDDFIAKIPDYLDILASAFEGWPGIHSPEAKDYFLKYQVTAAGWYVANPDLTVVETRKLKRIGQALDEFLDKVGD